AAGTFSSFIERQRHVNDCARANTSCLDALRTDETLQFTHVYAPIEAHHGCCTPLIDALRRDARFALVYENVAAQIYEWSAPASSPPLANP
ncbi:MAG TPA: hypothetical protein VE869_13725, partial [Gemmatimonas sp.]|nr:hypothetical protein [Gemmatimonas sp.]